ncbi:MAG: ferritin-like domain-containing protein [Actinomycetota bacterium]|nr:ferritin-like domain-containing protein [Actinomycetota bacterium]
MPINERAFHELMVESQDLQADAMQGVPGTLNDLADVREERRNEPIDVDEVKNFNDGRRRMLSEGGLGMGQLAARGLLATAFGGVLAGIVAAPANAASPLDVQILQTASSLEILAVATYGAALKLPFIASNKTVAAFATMTMKQHDQHNDAFAAQAKALGGKAQTAPNPKYLKVVNDTKPMLTDAAKVVTLAMALEGVATETYVKNLGMITDTQTKTLMATVAGVETQHLATLRAVGALLAANMPELIAIPTNLAKLPAAAGSVAFPKPFQETTMASPPAEGAVK